MFTKLNTLKELFLFFGKGSFGWLIPMLIVFLVVGILIIFVGSSPLAPIVYPLFKIDENNNLKRN